VLLKKWLAIAQISAIGCCARPHHGDK